MNYATYGMLRKRCNGEYSVENCLTIADQESKWDGYPLLKLLGYFVSGGNKRLARSPTKTENHHIRIYKLHERSLSSPSSLFLTSFMHIFKY